MASLIRWHSQITSTLSPYSPNGNDPARRFPQPGQAQAIGTPRRPNLRLRLAGCDQDRIAARSLKRVDRSSTIAPINDPTTPAGCRKPPCDALGKSVRRLEIASIGMLSGESAHSTAPQVDRCALADLDRGLLDVGVVQVQPGLVLRVVSCRWVRHEVHPFRRLPVKLAPRVGCHRAGYPQATRSTTRRLRPRPRTRDPERAGVSTDEGLARCKQSIRAGAHGTSALVALPGPHRLYDPVDTNLTTPSTAFLI